jgi:hypothetical protein
MLLKREMPLMEGEDENKHAVRAINGTSIVTLAELAELSAGSSFLSRGNHHSPTTLFSRTESTLPWLQSTANLISALRLSAQLSIFQKSQWPTARAEIDYLSFEYFWLRSVRLSCRHFSSTIVARSSEAMCPARLGMLLDGIFATRRPASEKNQISAGALWIPRTLGVSEGFSCRRTLTRPSALREVF